MRASHTLLYRGQSQRRVRERKKDRTIQLVGFCALKYEVIVGGKSRDKRGENQEFARKQGVRKRHEGNELEVRKTGEREIEVKKKFSVVFSI